MWGREVIKIKESFEVKMKRKNREINEYGIEIIGNGERIIMINDS